MGLGNRVSGRAFAKAPGAPDASWRPNRPTVGRSDRRDGGRGLVRSDGGGRRMWRDRVAGGLVADLKAGARGQSSAAPLRAWQGPRRVTVTAVATRTKAIVHRGDHHARPRAIQMSPKRSHVLGTVTAIEGIIRQHDRSPSNGATGGGHRCCCLTPLAVTRARLPFRFERSPRWSGSRWTVAIENVATGPCGQLCCRSGWMPNVAQLAPEVFALTCNEIRLPPSLGQDEPRKDGAGMRLSWR